MNNSSRQGNGTRWGAAVWTAGVAVLIAALPWAASDRLPDRLATHWKASAADGSMPLWAASLVPALVWLVLGVGMEVLRRRAGEDGLAVTRPRALAGLLSAGVLIVGGQLSVVRANLDHTDWHQVRLPIAGIVVSLVAAVLAGIAGWLVGTRGQVSGPASPGRNTDGPTLEIPEGQRVVWFSRTTNLWLHLVAAVTGVVAVAALVALVAGLAGPGAGWSLFASCAIASLAGAGCASVQTRVSRRGLEVAFGPLGWPVRRWAPDAIESARAENRTPAQVGGWGYRFSGLGTTVMLRAGACLVIRARGSRSDFAVSVDDAERGAALLNALRTHQPS
ncbi:DUF1648 domain-containing protein [Streptomyces sp. NPDC001698]|uniref:DUF1648 domain-containing protein n=1 Tax=Streptomyces sp. NPDC001698 TaxID=3364601 RepID=UPI003681DD49